VLEALAAKHRASLRRLEWNSGFCAALRAGGPGFRPGAAAAGGALGLAVLTSLGIVLELLVVKEKLLTGGENKVAAAIRALQNLIDEVHPASLAPDATITAGSSGQSEAGRKS